MAGARGRVRQERSLRNDRRILTAAIDVIANEGYSGLSLTEVARCAGLSIRPVRDRFPDRFALASAIWADGVSPPLVASLESLVTAAQEADEESLLAALQSLTVPDMRLRVATELLIVSTHDAPTAELVAADLGRQLARWLNPRGRGGSTAAAARGYVLMLAFGLILESWRADASRIVLDGEVAALCRALRAPTRLRSLPTQSAVHLDASPLLDTGDPAWDAMLASTLEQVGRKGYDKATVEAIANEAGYSQTVLFSRYPTKRDAFLDATRRMFAASTDLNRAYQLRMAARSSPGIAEAVMLREYMKPGRELARIVGLEQYRLAWHDPEMRLALESEQMGFRREYRRAHAQLTDAQFRARLHMEHAIGMGPVLLAQLSPTAWRLPYSAITVPLIDR